jgi:hypothetical protein
MPIPQNKNKEPLAKDKTTEVASSTSFFELGLSETVVHSFDNPHKGDSCFCVL